ncbi:hypothetical protein [Ruminococcus sp.]|uniref:hypothetical protein n=1 Tax=Ruminococcus sp. TaxID=41978 RepID=UPI00260516EA|nr:hypothetical protein [Ruminococcus sp.]MEE0022050.1 hypothetical protein [Ruminococcus sp.]
MRTVSRDFCVICRNGIETTEIPYRACGRKASACRQKYEGQHWTRAKTPMDSAAENWCPGTTPESRTERWNRIGEIEMAQACSCGAAGVPHDRNGIAADNGPGRRTGRDSGG